MNERSVSVIIPACNAEVSLGQSIDSALHQTLVPHEVIVVNDDSTDGTENIAKSYGDKIIYLEQENAGQGAARNAGLRIAKGKFVAFLDADDYWSPGFLENCVSFLLKHEEAIAVSTGLVMKMFNGEEKILPAFLNNPTHSTKPTMLENFFQYWAEHDHVRTGSNVIRRDVVEEAGFQRTDLRISEDLEYWGYIATFGKWGFIPRPLWVCNSRAAAVRAGWMKRYMKRRSLCPTVEAWQSRILPRLKEEEIHYFETIRGRVALGFAQNKIISGNYSKALEIVNKYGTSMPYSRLTMIMQKGSKLGKPGWLLTCLLIFIKEMTKGWYLSRKYKHTNASSE